MARLGVARQGEEIGAGRGTAWPGSAWLGKARKSWRGEARLGEVGRGWARHLRPSYNPRVTNLNSESKYAGLPEAVRFALEQWSKGLNVCLPGLVADYDPASRRVSVQPAIYTLMTDGALIDPPVIPNVPVVWPGGGGFVATFPLAAGDPVILIFSQRGLTAFKTAHDLSPPDPDALLSIRDAFCIPALGKPGAITPASQTGAAIQSEDGAEFIAIEPGGIQIRTTGRVSLTDSTGTRDL